MKPRLIAQLQPPLRNLPHCIQHRAVDPLDDCNGAFSCSRPLRFAAADALDFAFDVGKWADRELRSFHGVDQVLAPWVDGDATLGDDYVNQFSRTAQRGDLVDLIGTTPGPRIPENGVSGNNKPGRSAL